MRVSLSHQLQQLFNDVTPQTCRLCQAPCELLGGKTTNTTTAPAPLNSPLCQACYDTLGDHPWRCYCCALPLTSADAQLCGECLKQPPAFTRSLTACDYQAPASQFIQRFKYRRQLADGSLLCQRLLDRIQQQYHPQTLPNALMAVPNHWRRQLARGYNQAAWLTQQLSRELNIPQIAPLKRHNYSHAQQGLGRAERLRNLRHSFSCPSSPALNPELLAGQHIALVDDVVTTTATSNTISTLLMNLGASRVDVWSLARTPKSGHSPPH